MVMERYQPENLDQLSFVMAGIADKFTQSARGRLLCPGMAAVVATKEKPRPQGRGSNWSVQVAG
jgi:hypothetical protein